MPAELSQITKFLVDTGALFWNFFISHWFTFSILFVSFIFPKVVSLFRRSIGK